ncbi:MAG: tyrosine-type recombinase/integrase [Hyphomicrobiaceae bacterium]
MSDSSRATTILTNSRGVPWKSTTFKSAWNRASKAAGIKGLTFHDLRGTAITRLSEAGCTNIEIAAITGHGLQHIGQILDKYPARAQTLARSAIHKLEKKMKTKSDI